MTSHPTKNIAAVVPEARAQVEVQERPIPKPGSTQLLVRNHAVAVNPADWMIQESGAFVETYPNVLGSDIAGEVAAVGDQVTLFKVGERVTGFALVIANSDPDQGAFQTYTLLEEVATARLPSNIDYEAGATIPMGAATAGAGLFMTLGVPVPEGDAFNPTQHQGQGFLVWGASSSVGSWAVQLAKQAGFTVFATASKQHREYIRSLGADFFFDRNADAETIVEAAKEADVSIKLALDAVSTPATQPVSAQVLLQSGGPGSKLALTLSPHESLAKFEGIEASQTGAFYSFTKFPHIGAYIFNRYLTKALEAKTVVPSPPVRLVEGGLKATQQAWNLNKQGVSGQKIVVRVD